MSDEQKKVEETKAPEVKVVEKKESTSAKATVDAGEKKEEKKEVSAKFKDIVEKIEKLSVLELSELVKELEDRFGVSAAAPVSLAMPAAGGAAAPAAEEKTSFTLHLADAGAQKIAVIKAVRVILPDLDSKKPKI